MEKQWICLLGAQLAVYEERMANVTQEDVGGPGELEVLWPHGKDGG